MSDLRKSNRGGYRPGAGRPTDAQRKLKAENAPTSTSNNKADVLSAPIKIKLDGKNVKLDVVTEMAEIYMELKNKTLDKDEARRLMDRIAILEKLLPYSTSKKPIASTRDESKQATTVKIEGVNLDEL